MSIPGRYPKSQFSPCPAGLHPAVCVDVIDLGERDTLFGRKYQVRLAWQIPEIDPATKRRHNVIKTYTNSLHKRANLRADLESWRGKKFTEDEAKRLDLESVLGVNAMLHVVHEAAEDGTVYANVKGVMPTPSGTPKLAGLDYVRQQDRDRLSAKPTTWPTKPAPRLAPPIIDTPMPDASETAAPPDDAVPVDFDAEKDDDNAVGF